MKHVYLLFFLLLTAATSVLAQDFEEGLQLFEEQNFREAAEIFTALDDDRSLLFAGKSYFGLQEYMRANEYLYAVARQTGDDLLRQEAKYTVALSYFRMKNHAGSLDMLHEVINSENRSRIRVDAQQMYRQIMNYLSISERYQVLKNSRYSQVAQDLVRSSFNTVPGMQYNALVEGLLQRTINSEQQSRLANELRDTSRVGSGSAQYTYPEPPDGMVYNIGVILPAADGDSRSDLMVSRNLYLGMTMAAEEFNSQHAEKKVFLQFLNSGSNPDSAASAFQKLILNHHVDAVIGPLYSESAKRVAELAEEHSIPMIAPLANSDEINLNFNYTFQMNPTFEVHGRKMARHAVQTLGLDTLAVISQRDALGTSSARSFRREAEKLGAFISYYIEEDFSDYGYDLTEFTKVFTTDSVEIAENNFISTKGIYAPFTGQAANTLINLLLTDLEVFESDMTIMGSEEWENASLSTWQERNFEIYYTEAFGQTADSAAAEYILRDFETRFGVEPDRFATLGYDVGSFVFQNLNRAGNPVYLREVLKNSTRYEGLELSIFMDQQRINQHLFIRPLTPSAENRLE
ncbi:MAG: ABC transporter substrate-binding protein [Bacteroidetes bacterium]|jgi:ABC-type branched-subunit amino acid transport system substrate-binding protein|nr:ABC transporter substrate-binding protein [Bacteroidota bacterium]